MKYLEVVTYHATQIVSTADLKTHLRITFSDDDAYFDVDNDIVYQWDHDGWSAANG